MLVCQKLYQNGHEAGQYNNKGGLLTGRPNLHVYVDVLCPPEKFARENRHLLSGCCCHSNIYPLSGYHTKFSIKTRHSPQLNFSSIKNGIHSDSMPTAFYVLKNPICPQRMKICGSLEKVTRMCSILCKKFQMKSSTSTV